MAFDASDNEHTEPGRDGSLTLPDRPAPSTEYTDKRGYAARWGVSSRSVDSWLSQGLPYFRLGPKTVRIAIPDADAWMRETFRARRRKRSLPTPGLAGTECTQ